MKILSFALLSILFISGCSKGSGEKESPVNYQPEKPQSIGIDEIEPGPVLRDSLSLDQEEKITFVHQTFSEVSPTSLEQMKADFMRDQNPDKEIAIWVAMAEAYQTYTKDKELDLDQKKETYEILLIRSLFPEEEALQNVQLKFLSEEEARAVMAGYTLEGEPILIHEQEKQ